MPACPAAEGPGPDGGYLRTHRQGFDVALHWEVRRALELALFHTFAIPAISGLLDRTGKFADHGQQRYDDTVALLREVAKDGPASPRGHAAIRRINQAHRPFGIANRDYLYVLTTFVVVPVRWVSRYGWRNLTETEVRAAVSYYRELGRLMGIRQVPQTYAGFARYFDDYERDHRCLTEANHRLALAMIATMEAWFPRVFRPLARQCIIAAFGTSLRTALGLPRPWRAARVCDAGYEGTLPVIRGGAKETDVCAAGHAATMKAGADFVRYVRTYSGPYSAFGVRWPQATDRQMANGELLVTDIVGACWGQQFDVNRTFVVGRKATDERRRQLDAALEATRAAIAVARPGVPAQQLVITANRVIEDRGFGQHARPFIGHGIGYETMEPPLLYMGDTTPLEPGMVLCVEPGIEIPGAEGVRIEEEIIVTEGEPELITRFDPRQWE